MSNKTWSVMILALGLIILAPGCAAVKGGLATVRTTVNKALDVADKTVVTAETTFQSALNGSKETVTTATTAP